MTAAFFDYPKAAAFGRVVSKSRIYEHAGVNAGVKMHQLAGVKVPHG